MCVSSHLSAHLKRLYRWSWSGHRVLSTCVLLSQQVLSAGHLHTSCGLIPLVWAFSDKSLYPSLISITTDPSAKKSVCVCLCFTLNCVCEGERDRVGRSKNVKHIEFTQDGFRGVCQDQLLTEALMPWNTVIFHTSSKWLFAVTDTWLWNGKNVLSEVTSLYSFSIASALCRNPVKCKSTSHLTPVINPYNCKYTASHFSLLSRPCCHGNGLPIVLKLSKCLLNNLISSLTLWVSTEQSSFKLYHVKPHHLHRLMILI